MANSGEHTMTDFFDVTPLSFIRAMQRNGEDIRDMSEVLHNASEGKRDYHGFRYRVMHKDDALKILTEELTCDPYILGSFMPRFLSEITGVPEKIISAAQSAEKYEDIGQWLIDDNYAEDIAEAYSEADGFGHHFAHYDGETHHEGDWLVFKTC